MKAILITFATVLFGLCTQAQDSLELKYPKTYKAVFKTIHALPEVKEFLISAKGSEPVAYIGGPNNSWRNYWEVQVGVSNLDMLRTNFYLFVDAKSLQVYYLDNYDNGHGLDFKLITLQQWRKWRTPKPGKKRIGIKTGN